MSHTIFRTIFPTPSFTHHLSHTTLSHTIFHTQLCRTPSLTHHFVTPLCHTPSFTHNFVTHHLLHTIFDTQLCTHHLSHILCRTPSFTHNFVTHHLSPHQLSHTIFHTTLSHALFHTQLSHTHTIFHTQLCPSYHLSLSHTIFHIQLCLTQLCFISRSSTNSFVFPSFPVPATKFGAHYWKKLPCGVIRSFNWLRPMHWKVSLLEPSSCSTRLNIDALLKSFNSHVAHAGALVQQVQRVQYGVNTCVCVCPLVDGLHPSAGVCATKTLTAFR